MQPYTINIKGKRVLATIKPVVSMHTRLLDYQFERYKQLRMTAATQDADSAGRAA